MKKIFFASFLILLFFYLSPNLIQIQADTLVMTDEAWDQLKEFRGRYPTDEYQRFKAENPDVSPSGERVAFENWLAGQRAGCPSEGLVPCGTEGCPCQLCDFFVMFKRIIDFVLFRIVPLVAVLMILIGGFMYIVAFINPSEGGPEMLSRAKSLFKSVAIGLLLVYAAWLIVNTFFMVIGINEVDFKGLPENWWKINCN